MTTFEEMLQEMVNLSDEQKLSMIIDAYKKLLPTLQTLDPKTNGMALTLGIMSTAVGADGKLHVKEFAVIGALLKACGATASDEQILKMIQASTSKEALDMVVTLGGILDADGKAALVTFIAGLCSIDDQISREEAILIAGVLQQ